MKTDFLVLGATGGIGYAVVKALLDRKIPTTILVRDYKKAQRLFGANPILQVTLGNAEDAKLLNELSAGKTHIFHGVSAPYEQWADIMPSLTRNVINAAAEHQATVVFPGNNYNYGCIKQPITEITPFQPVTDLGRVRVALETQIREAARLGRIKALIVRLPEIWGPNVCNKSFEPVFIKQLQGKSIPWLFDIDTPQQMAFNMDAGRAIAALSLRENRPGSEVVNYAGTTFSSMRDFFSQLAQVADKPMKTSVLSKGLISFLAKVNPGLKQIKSLQYKFENTILLDGSTFQNALPDFEQTETATALAETLDWFKANRLLPGSREKKQKRKALIVDFVADNLSIGIFPLLIGLLGNQFPAIKSMTVLFGVVAGIYWSPLIRKLFRKIAPARKLIMGLLILAFLTLINNPATAQNDPLNERITYFDGFYGKLETGSQNVFSGALIDGIDVLTNKGSLVTSMAFGFRRQVVSERLVIGSEIQLGLVDGGLSKNYHNGEQMLVINYENKVQTGFGLSLGAVPDPAKKWLIYVYGYSTKRSFDISFIEENGFEHQQTDENTFLRYGVGIETRLSHKWSISGSLGKVYVDFGDAITTQSVTDLVDLSIGLVFRFSQ